MDSLNINFLTYMFVSVLFNFILMGYLFFVFKKTNSEYYQFTKNKLIISIIYLVITTITLIIFTFNNFGNINNLSLIYLIGLILLIFFNIILNFIIFYFVVCSIIYFINRKSKVFSKKEKYFSIINILFLNPYVKYLLFSLFLLLFFSNNMVECGVGIEEILENSALNSTEIQAGDVILGIDDEEILTSNDFIRIIDSKSPGDNIKLLTNKGEFEIILLKSPNNSSKAYIGFKPNYNYCMLD